MKKIVKVELIQLLKRVITLLESKDVPEDVKELTLEEINPEDAGRGEFPLRD